MLSRSIAYILIKPFFQRSSSLNRSQTLVQTKRKRKLISLSQLDEFIFQTLQPSQKFLETTYGVHAKLVGTRNRQQVKQTFNNIEQLFNTIYGSYFMNEMKRNKIDNRTILLQYAANNPIEDRYKLFQLTAIDGFVVSVIDGHGGWQLAELAMSKLHLIINENLLHCIKHDDESIQKCIENAFQQVEEEFFKIAIEAFEFGYSQVAKVGACVLTTVVVNNKVYSANLGDCKGIIVNVENKDFRKINRSLNANSKKEQQRLKTKFDDEDIIVQRNDKRANYVKNMLQPTKTLGDFRLKHSKFTMLPDFRGPYIDSTPEQKVFQLQKGDRYLIMGSDGLWDIMTKQQICESQIVNHNDSNKEYIIKQIFEKLLSQVAMANNMTEEQIRKIPLGRRRRIHDDITIIVVDLQNQH